MTGSSYADPARMRAYLHDHAEAFPGMSADVAGNELVTGYWESVEALAAGLEAAGERSEPLPAALAHLRVDLLGGQVRLDSNRQAVTSTTLVRIEPPGQPAPGLERERTVSDVDQSVGGTLAPSMVPSDQPARCRG